ncbi:hypothetical protein GCM10010278_66120 [Streptomyces melanogenes]|nr:hypothetical protein GCM10010278_66120 [Streptomyces melanogenes]
MLLAVAAVAMAAGCGGDTEKAKPPTASSRETVPAVADAARAYRDDLNALSWSGCPADCDKDLTEIVANARVLRQAMNADAAGAGFWSPAYRLIDQIEEGRAKASGDVTWNRPLILGPAHKLNEWLTTHPSQ